MAISVDRIHQQYQKENVVDFDFDVVGLVVATMIDGGGSDEESKEFQKLSLTHVPQVPKKESMEFQKLSLTDLPPQPQVPKKKVDDGGKELEQKPVAARVEEVTYYRGVCDNGNWCTEPATVKDIFKNQFQTRFEQPQQSRFKINFQFDKRLSADQVMDLDSMVTREEIRRAVWSCGDDKSPGPDGFSFEFFRKYWNFIGPDFCGAVEHFFNKGTFTRGCNSSFIALIPKISDAKYVSDYRPISLIGCVYKVVTKILAIRLANIISDIISDTQSAFLTKRNILDGPFILNELLSWCKKYNKQAMFFKVDFAKAYDCVRWDYLLDVMKSFGFGPNWCRWIQGTLSSAKASILVNGSPTAEFSFYRGLKQGDPLSPFLFILIMESLHLSMVRASSNGMFRGLCLNGSLSVSHLFYADDAMFIGEWSQANLDNVVKMLQCFQVASGLSINIQKSNLLGVGVRRSVVDQAANKIGCLVMSNRFSYLGVMVGDSMNRRAAWVEVINKLRARLSNWKVKTLSIGGRYTLLKSVLGSSPLYHMSIFKTPKGVLKEMEGIRGKFFNGADPEERKIVWVAWQKVLASKSQGGLGVSSFFALNRALLLKWYWRFLTKDGSYDTLYKNLYATMSISSVMAITPNADRWVCDLTGDGNFRVKEVRNFLDDLVLPSSTESTRWVKWVPIKTNIFIWKARRDCLPTRFNLSRKGVMLDSILCPLCDHAVETTQHVLFQCPIVRSVFHRICNWWELEGQDLESFSEWQSWFLSIRMSAGTKNLLDGVFATFWWNATVRRWGPLYVDQPTNEDDWTTYSIFGYTWAFKTWILESFRVNATRYYERLNQYPRVAAWRKRKGRFTVEKVLPLFEGNIPIARLTPDDIEARSDWWISSKAYFDGFIDQVERVPFDVSRQNMEEIPSGIYRQFVEQKIELERNKKAVDDIKEEMQKFREEMNARPVRQENIVPIIAGPHYGLSDFSEFRSMPAGPSSFMNMGTPPNIQTPMWSQPGSYDRQRQMPEQSASHYWQPSSHPGSYASFGQGQVPSHMGRPDMQFTIDTQHVLS
ncbi:RNA-directed DNA polymerase, eukaryota, partial [Tanacetum coccineum]